MAKELPYFRFTPQEWQNGDISIENNELKGLFIDVCSYYWIKDCSITQAMLEKRFSNDKELLYKLIDLNIVKIDDEHDYIEISFLDEQFDILSEARKKRQEAGSKGGKARSSNAKAMLKQCPSYKDKDKDKDNDKKKEHKKSKLDLVREFYAKELDKAAQEGAGEYLQIVRMMFDHENQNENPYELLTILEQQLTFEQYKKLTQIRDKKTTIKDAIIALENFKAKAKYKSVYLTLNNWLK